MDCSKATIVALVKLLGSPLSTHEILDLYSQYYQETKVELARAEKPAEVEISKRTW